MSNRLPNAMSKHGMKFRLAVLKVIEKDPHGRPTKFEWIHEEQTTHIDGGEEFVTVYIPVCFFKDIVPS